MQVELAFTSGDDSGDCVGSRNVGPPTPLGRLWYNIRFSCWTAKAGSRNHMKTNA